MNGCHYLSAIDWAVFAAYVLAVLALGACARGQHTNEDFLVGGRRMWWVAIGLSMFASIFSSNSYVGLPAEAANGSHGYHAYLAILWIPLVCVPLVGWLFLPFFHRLQVTSAYEYLELRFNRPVRLIASLLFAMYTFLWMGNLLHAVTKVAGPIFRMSPDDLPQKAAMLVGIGLFATIYTAVGGFKAVIWTDVLQAFALGGGMLLILLLAVPQVAGGWVAVWDIGQRYGRFEMFDMQFDPTLRETNFYSAASMGLFMFLPWYAATLTAVQRYVAMPTIGAARRALALNGAMVGVVCLLFFAVGSTLFAFYHQDIPTRAGAGTGFPTVENKEGEIEPMPNDELLSYFVIREIPVTGLLGLLLAGLFAAAMSSVDSGINALTAAVVCDWLPGTKPGLAFSRVLCILFGVGAIAASIFILYKQADVYQVVITISGTFLGFVLGLFLLGMVVARANGPGALIGLLFGCVALLLAYILKVDHAWYGAYTCVPTFAGGAIASCLFPPPDDSQVRGLVWGHGRPGEVEHAAMGVRGQPS